MITKNATIFMDKVATFPIGAVVGGARSMELSEDEAAYLRKHYGLDDDSSLVARNAGRGLLGGTAGLAAGGAVGALTNNPALLGLGALGGTLAGSLISTNKYSKGRIRELRQRDVAPRTGDGVQAAARGIRYRDGQGMGLRGAAHGQGLAEDCAQSE